MICIKENIINETVIPPAIQAKHNTKVSNKEKQIHKYAYQKLLNQLIFGAELEIIYTDMYIATTIYIDIDQNQI